jgi:hypothetical protein
MKSNLGDDYRNVMQACNIYGNIYGNWMKARSEPDRSRAEALAKAGARSSRESPRGR